MEGSSMDNISGLFTNIVGAKCKIVATPVSYGFKMALSEEEGFTVDTIHTISGVYHRVTTDGRIHPVYELEGIKGRLFKPSELWITCIPPQNNE